MLRNAQWPRRQRQILYTYVGIAGALTVVGVVTDGLAMMLIGPWIMVTMAIPMAYGPQWIGSIYSQRELVVEDSGMRYGERYFVPWSSIEGVRRRCRLGRSPRVALLAPKWRPGGIAWFLERHRGLPLSDYDENWRDNSELVYALREHLPEHLDALGIS